MSQPEGGLGGQPSIGKAFTRRPVEAVVGPSKTIYYIHPDALASHSFFWRTGLDTAQSTGDATFDWSRFDCETVDLVLKWIYTGEYFGPFPTSESPFEDEEKAEGKSEDASNLFCSEDTSGQETHTATSPDDLTSPLLNQLNVTRDNDKIMIESQTENAIPGLGCIEQPPPKKATFTPGAALLAHTKVYVFARQFFVEKLKPLSIDHLTQILDACATNAEISQLFPQFMEAAKLVCSGTRTEDAAVRNLFSTFAASNLEHITDNLEALASIGVVFVTDLLLRTAERCTSQREEIQTQRKRKRLFRRKYKAEKSNSEPGERDDQCTDE